MNSYCINTINDLLLVPAERRKDCLNELHAALLLHELAFGCRAVGIKGFVWVDDGVKGTAIHSTDGTPIVTMTTTTSEPN